MAAERSPISQAISDVLTGFYKTRRLTQEVVAERAGMSITTLQKKLSGKGPITATDLVVLSQAIGVEPGRVITDAMELLNSVSDAPVSLDAHRKAKSPAEMSDDEIDELQGAAGHDPELEEPEPNPT
jgi:transcriptional regulator with XRE-family HTH domain